MKSLFTLLATTAVAAATTWSGRVTTLQEPTATAPTQETAQPKAELRADTRAPEAILVRLARTEPNTVPVLESVPLVLNRTIGVGAPPAIVGGVTFTPNTREAPAGDRDEELARLRKRLAELEEELARREARANGRPREVQEEEVRVRGRQIEVLPNRGGGFLRAQGDVEVQTRGIVREARELAERERNRAEEARALAEQERHRAMEARARAEEMREQSAAIAREAERARDEALELRARMLAETQAQVDALRAETKRAVRDADVQRLRLGRPDSDHPLVARVYNTAPTPPVAPSPPVAPAPPAPPAHWPAEAAMPARPMPPATSIHIHVEEGDVHIHHGAGAAEVHVERKSGDPAAPNSKPDTDKGQKAGPSAPKSKKDKDRVSHVESQGLELLETMDPDVPMTVALSAITALEDLDLEHVALGGLFNQTNAVDLLLFPESAKSSSLAKSVAQALAPGRGITTAPQAAVVEEPALDELLRLVREMHADLTALREELSALRGEVEVAPLRGAR